MSAKYVPRSCTEEELTVLEGWASGGAPDPELERRAKLVVMARSGIPRRRIADELGFGLSKAAMWIRRFDDGGPGGLRDRIPGRQPVVSGYAAAREAVTRLLAGPLPEGSRQWSVRLVGQELRMHVSRVREVLEREGIGLANRAGLPARLASSPPSEEHAEILSLWAGGDAPSARVASRARLIQAVLAGEKCQEVARICGTSLRQVFEWTARFASEGPDGLLDRPGRGRPRGRTLAGRKLRLLQKLVGSSPPGGAGAWTPEAAGERLGLDLASVRKTFAALGILPGSPGVAAGPPVAGDSPTGEESPGAGELPSGAEAVLTGAGDLQAAALGAGGAGGPGLPDGDGAVPAGGSQALPEPIPGSVPVGGGAPAAGELPAGAKVSAAGKTVAGTGGADMDLLRSWASGGAPNGEAAVKAGSVLAVLEGARVKETADLHGLEYWRLRYWVSCFLQGGTEGLAGRKSETAAGERAEARLAARDDLRERARALAAGPPPGGLDSWDWNSLARELGVPRTRLKLAMRKSGFRLGPGGPARKAAAAAAVAAAALPGLYREILDAWAECWDGTRPGPGPDGRARGADSLRPLAWRARIVQACLEGRSASEAAAMCGASGCMASKYLRLYLDRGPVALLASPLSGLGLAVGFPASGLTSRAVRKMAEALLSAPPPRGAEWDLADAALFLGVPRDRLREELGRAGVILAERPDGGGRDGLPDPSPDNRRDGQGESR
ncbi:MAG: helix-turn-helix domain-containing protein [Deltaproteobacteria bacterium]|jgi:transposase|nr:helix-turn-helix domain-containing protein [Deltaproteobacteria bacterium]